ncbi:hypothetical protein [uncultured Brevundimonas sp.]|uniref:hypothetical protein n=1 Tax=uncultured Brevundimonas sp. TaxID=213418 RepID=UPI00263841E7|nr:hypothetical protein [uncultured Brevundimonas sp.]
MSGYIDVATIETKRWPASVFVAHARETIGAFHIGGATPPFDLWSVAVHSVAPGVKIHGVIVGVEAARNGWRFRFLSFDRRGEPHVQVLPGSHLQRPDQDDA